MGQGAGTISQPRQSLQGHDLSGLRLQPADQRCGGAGIALQLPPAQPGLPVQAGVQSSLHVQAAKPLDDIPSLQLRAAAEHRLHLASQAALRVTLGVGGKGGDTRLSASPLGAGQGRA